MCILPDTAFIVIVCARAEPFVHRVAVSASRPGRAIDERIKTTTIDAEKEPFLGVPCTVKVGENDRRLRVTLQLLLLLTGRPYLRSLSLARIGRNPLR